MYRYMSRCLLVEFQDPPLSLTLTQHMHLVELWKKCSSCIGHCIELGERFFKKGVSEVDDIIIPKLNSRAQQGISPRVIVSYAKLLWFAQEVIEHMFVVEDDWQCWLSIMQILNTAGLSGSHQRLQDHFADHVLHTASKLQSWSDVQAEQVSVPDQFGIAL